MTQLGHHTILSTPALHNAPQAADFLRNGRPTSPKYAVEGRVEVADLQEGVCSWTPGLHVSGHDLALDAWARDGRKLFGRVREGVSSYLVEIETVAGTVRRLTPTGRTVSHPGARCLSDAALLFPIQGPTYPLELWTHRPEKPLRRVSRFQAGIAADRLPEVRTIHYPSDGWSIEALLVLPPGYQPGKSYPTLFYLHGGPESCVEASFATLVSARAQSAAHFLAGRGYVVLLPNFRGSSGYGPDFENQLGDYQIVRRPYQDLMAGADALVEQGIADPERLGVYGDSFGGWLTAWTVGQTCRFKGAMAAIGLYDLLRFDRVAGRPFYSWEPNRLGDADPQALWNCPEMYREFSPMEHIASVNTPLLIIQTGAEETRAWVHQGRMLYNGLRALGIESYLVHYPQAYHNGGWNDAYKRDYMKRLAAWFDHCLGGAGLPEWFVKRSPEPEPESLTR